jgi:hypothetical protein
MHIELGEDEVQALRELLQEKVTELDKEINRADSLRFKDELRRTERTIERILGRVADRPASAPIEWEPRDGVVDEDHGGHS